MSDDGTYKIVLIPVEITCFSITTVTNIKKCIKMDLLFVTLKAEVNSLFLYEISLRSTLSGLCFKALKSWVSSDQRRQ